MKLSTVPDTVTKLYRLRADMTPTKPAFFTRSAKGGWSYRTWSEVWQEIRNVANGLREQGLQRGECIGVLLPTCYEWELVHQAALYVGAVVIGIDPNTSADEICWKLKQSSARFVVIMDQNARAIAEFRRTNMRIICIGDTAQAGTNLLNWESLKKIGSCRSASIDEPASQDIATIVYTSGSTGKPKGIEISHGKLMAACRAVTEVYAELGENDTTLCWLPMTALFQRMANLLAVACGMQIYFIDDSHSIVRSLLELKPSFVIGVPRFFEKLDEATRSLDCSLIQSWTNRLKYLVSGSAPLSTSILTSLHDRGMLVLEAYGLSENTVPIAANRANSFRFGSVGKPLIVNQIRFAQDGEILIKSPGLFSGYYRESPLHSSFTEDGFYQTGDCGHLDDDGYLYLTGRKSEIIKTSTGRRISPTNIEAVYMQSKYIDQIVVFGEGRKYLVGLAVVNQMAVHGHLSSLDAAESPDESDANSAIRRLFLNELENFENSLPKHQLVQALGLLREPFSVDRGELTLSLKLRRRVIAEHYSDIIERLYEAPLPCVLLAWDTCDNCLSNTVSKL